MYWTSLKIFRKTTQKIAANEIVALTVINAWGFVLILILKNIVIFNSLYAMAQRNDQ